VRPGAAAGNLLRNIMVFYREGFRGMTLGRSLWLVVAIKILVIFGLLKIFFFPDFLESGFSTDRQRADFVLEQLTPPIPEPTTGSESP